jgi:Uma2 family endonuclease
MAILPERQGPSGHVRGITACALGTRHAMGGREHAPPDRGGTVELMVSAAAQRPLDPDPTHYPVEDEMGESVLHKLIVHVLWTQVQRLLAGREPPCFVGSNQFIYWVQYAPTRSVAPDVYVLPGVPRDAAPKSWKVWETGVAPTFAIEVVSDDVRKDYEGSPVRYAELGVRELVVFDPESTASPDRVRWQVFRRVPRGGLALVERTDGDAVRSEVLGCWLRTVGVGSSLRVRVAAGANGEDLLPTEGEAEHAAEQRALEAERQALEAERHAQDAESARVAAEVEAAGLRAELERLRRGP